MHFSCLPSSDKAFIIPPVSSVYSVINSNARVPGIFPNPQPSEGLLSAMSSKLRALTSHLLETFFSCVSSFASFIPQLLTRCIILLKTGFVEWQT